MRHTFRKEKKEDSNSTPWPCLLRTCEAREVDCEVKKNGEHACGSVYPVVKRGRKKRACGKTSVLPHCLTPAKSLGSGCHSRRMTFSGRSLQSLFVWGQVWVFFVGAVFWGFLFFCRRWRATRWAIREVLQKLARQPAEDL